MSVKFSDKLIAQYQTYLKRRYDVVVSCEQAELDLDSLANLYLAYTPKATNPATNPSRAEGRGGGG